MFISMIRRSLIDRWRENSLRSLNVAKGIIPQKIRVWLHPLTAKVRRQFIGPTSAFSMRQTSWPARRPLVSVIVPSCNYGTYLQGALDSILNQTLKDFEIILVDSSDQADSIAAFKAVKHRKIKKFRREGLHLLGDNRNFAIKRARGKYICSLDPDDFLKPTYLEKAVFLLETKNYQVVGCGVQVFGEVQAVWQPPETPTMHALLIENCIPVVSVYSRRVWERCGGFFDYGRGKQHVHEDWDFWIRAMAVGARIHSMKAILFRYRKHSGSMSQNPDVPSKDEQRRLIKIRNNKYLLPRLIQRSNRLQEVECIVKNPLVNLASPRVIQDNTPCIIFALPYLVVGGADKRFRELGQWLSGKGVRIVLLLSEEQDPRQLDTRHHFEEFTSQIYSLPQLARNPADWPLFTRYLLESRNVKGILLGGSSYMYQQLPWIHREYSKIKIIDQQFNTACHFSSNLKFAEYIDHTIAENEEIAEKLARDYLVNSNKVSLIHNGVDVHGEFKPEPKSLGTGSKGIITVAFLGRLSAEKGPDIFLRVAEKFKDQGNLRFILAGPGPLEAELKALARELGLEDRVSFPGMVKSQELLSQCNVLLLPSRIDGRPNVVMEALAMGVPVIASHVGGIPQLLRQSETGFLCQIDAVDEFAERLTQLCSNADLLEHMSKSARRFAETNLASETCLRRYQELFESLDLLTPLSPQENKTHA